MAKVYVVFMREHMQVYHAEPYERETLLNIFDSEEKAISYIRDLIGRDHEYVDSQIAAGNVDFYKGSGFERVPESWFMCSYGRITNTYQKTTYYKYKSYELN